MRPLAIILALLVGAGALWNKYITRGGLVDYYDKNPKTQSAPAALFYLGKGYEFVGRYEHMRDIYGRILERYPESPYAMESHFGHALALERLGFYKDAIEEYQAFIEKYPNSKYARSVRNNIEILKSR
jgi:TolA-binding protein